MTFSEKIDEKIDSSAYKNATFAKDYKDGARIFKPLLVEMAELINDLEPSVLAEAHRIRRRGILNKLKGFLDEEGA